MKNFKSDNIIYHYTSLSTAIECIFKSGKLRLSPISRAFDPMESIIPLINLSAVGYEDQIQLIKETINGEELAKIIREYYKSLRQICFCQNNADLFELANKMSPNEPVEYFGFMKTRMWDQYADHYKGVCIAIDKNKFVSKLDDTFYPENVSYVNDNKLRANLDNSGINLNRAFEIGIDEYLKQKQDWIIKKLQEKYIDYQDENEFKIIQSSKEEFVEVDISDCIIGLFVTNKCNNVYDSILEGIQNTYNIKPYRIDFKRTGIYIREIN
jgi:hypothetical protein